ncbi:MAG: hypothetical protein U0Q08_05675 [Dermatophilaceae bacterium]
MPELFNDGAFVSPRDGGRRTITCPADGQVVGDVDEATEEDTLLAIGAARRAFDSSPGRPHRRPSAPRSWTGSRPARA